MREYSIDEVLTRNCTVCEKEKPFCEFAKDKRGKYGRRSDCLLCNCERSKKYQKNNAEKVLEKNRKYLEKNKEKIIQYRKDTRKHTQELANKRYKERPEVRQRIIEDVRKYRNNPKNKEKVRESVRNSNRKRRKNDPVFRLTMSLRRRMLFVLAGARKAEKSMELIGCTCEQLKAHLESLFTRGMTWENYGMHRLNGDPKWNIDHIRPCSSFDLSDPEQQRRCFHYTNLQPLWAIDNSRKGAKSPENLFRQS